LDPADVLIESYVSRLTLRQKIGQRFIAWVPGAAVSERARKLIQEGCVAGVILTAENVRSREQLAELTRTLQELAAGNSPPIGLLIGIDQEGGRVNRLRLEGVTQFPPPHYWAGHGDPQFIEAAAYIINREILDLGCNLNFAPVLDLYALPDQSVIGDRSMGDDGATVGRYGIAYLAGAQRAGVAPVAKHFPGHGGTAVDSHLQLPVVETDAQALAGRDLVPFRMAVEHGLDAVMTAHVLYPRLDPKYPATLSRPIVQGLLREQLGFRGVVISDGIGMRALQSHFSIEEILCRSIQAGVDLILGQSPYDILALEETVAALIRQGRIREAEIDEGVRRILLLKLKYGLLPPLAE
jgi:beta-N-acetylhexosaminidase